MRDFTNDPDLADEATADVECAVALTWPVRWSYEFPHAPGDYDSGWTAEASGWPVLTVAGVAIAITPEQANAIAAANGTPLAEMQRVALSEANDRANGW